MGETEHAISVPATRVSLQRRWLIVAGLALLAATALALAARAAGHDARASSLQRKGVLVDGTITAVEVRQVGRGRFPDGSVRVRFSAEGEIVESSVYVGGAVARLHADDVVRVVYDAAEPTRVELLGLTSPYTGVPAVPAAAIGVLLAVMASVAGRHAWCIRRNVRHEPWSPVPSHLEQRPQTIALRQGSVTLATIETPDGTITVEPVGFGRIDPGAEPTAWIAGLDRGSEMALATPGGRHVILVRRRRH